MLDVTSLVDIDVYRDAYDQVDFTLSKTLGERYKVSFSAKNITIPSVDPIMMLRGPRSLVVVTRKAPVSVSVSAEF